MHKKRNALFLPSWFPNKNHSTLGIFVQRHAEAVALFNNVAVLFVSSTEQDNLFVKEVETEKNIFTVRVYYKKVTGNIPLLSGIQKIYRYLKAYFIGYKEIISSFSKPEIIHLNVIFPAGIFALWLNIKYKIPVVISEHSSVYMLQDGLYKGFLMKWVTKTIVGRSKAVIAVSKDLKSWMLHHKLYGNYFVVPNVVNTAIFFPQEKRSFLGEEKKRLVHVSSINDKEKNISGILRMIHQLKQLRTDFYIDIIGDSVERPHFEKIADELGLLNKFIFFRGKQEQEKVAEFLRNADVLIAFSNYETFGCVLIEAFACGTPVIATNTGGMPELVNSTNGILVPVGDDEALLNAIQQVLNNPKNYDRELIAKNAIDNFSYEKVGKEITEIYNKVLS